ncbi:conserved hypothetical protein [Desulforamulus reducens MI-1]|uniref:DUF3298 domain-containing protein n=1 Tax=Desulforamulus reducens (strain ATCC BAA-1160 / DSM 100696 / MI-1) TaxID=349161 RepID=A4J6F7_DESRM|nr:DUF3298 and DUF4163 domain-containing protein [Desulforamulus reducens]ABO50660.1 conserved hypothetical protein [Desulforamulus reducens MI-1]
MKRNPNSVANIYEEAIQNECTDIIYPQVELTDKEVEKRINQYITQQVNKLIPSEGCDVYAEIFGRYEVKFNQKGVLSIILQFYTFPKGAANGLNIQKSINVDLSMGKSYQLYELFQRGKHHKVRLNRIIREQIKEKELVLITEFKGISDTEDYYLTDDALVIYFQQYEYTPRVAGIPEFIIPYYKISDIISENGLISKIIS